MSAQPAVRLFGDQEILGELLHSLSQPLTTLCCSLELSLEKAAGQQHESVAAALEQAERVITQVRLLREYLDAELSVPVARPVEFGPVLKWVVAQMSSLAAAGQVTLRIEGGTSATIAVSEARLRLALQYLIGILIEEQPAGSTITLRFEEHSGEPTLQATRENLPAGREPVSWAQDERRDRILAASRKVKLAIASRILDAAAASLAVNRSSDGFAIRIPQLSAQHV